jgi:hypothetical protein
MRAKLTPTLVKTATSGRMAAIASLRWGTALEGFGLMLMASGSQSYVVGYRHNSKSPRLSLSAVLDLTTARKKAKAILARRSGAGT